MIGLVALVLLVGGFGTWAATTTISGAVIAGGQIEVESNRQVVQHPDGGVVDEILVTEGQRVEAGEVLIRLDSTLLRSELNTVESQLYELMARRARLEAERDEAAFVTFPDALVEAAQDSAIAAELMQGQERLFEARNESIAREVETLERQSQQIEDQIEGIEAQQTALQSQLSLISQELESQQSLFDRGLAQASRVLSLQRESARLSGTVGELTANAAQARERISGIEIETLKLGTNRREAAITQTRDLQYRELELTERRNSLRERLSRLDITAPVDGVVYDLQVFAERSVIRPADPVLYLVPQDRPLVISARILPIHIDQVSVGQQVTLRFSAFSARTTPELFGHVTRLSADAFTDERTQQSYYRAEIRLDEGEIAKLPGQLALIPGMPVDAFIRTDDRTPMAFLVQPLSDYFSRAFREG
ncbi:HlyD family type I secretion periplasmic adaptor subunit [Mesobaculum littorinae]